MSAFWELSSCRQIHMGGAGPIPWDTLDRWACRAGYLEHDELYDDFMYLMRQLDEEFLEDQAVRRKREMGNGQTRGVRPPNGSPGEGRYIKRP